MDLRLQRHDNPKKYPVWFQFHSGTEVREHCTQQKKFSFLLLLIFILWLDLFIFFSQKCRFFLDCKPRSYHLHVAAHIFEQGSSNHLNCQAMEEYIIAKNVCKFEGNTIKSALYLGYKAPFGFHIR